MLSYLIVDHDKGIAQEAATAAIKRGTPLEGGAFIADKDKSYDGINAVIAPREIDNDDIAEGEVFNKVPTRVGEHYATSEVDGVVAAKDPLKVEGNKFKKTDAGAADWECVGEYANPFGVKMYHVKRIPTKTVGG